MSNAINALQDLQVSDEVTLKRNLDHPAFMVKSEIYDEYSGTYPYVRDPEASEILGVAHIVARREIHPAHTGARANTKLKTLVRLTNSFWYDCATGLQDGSGATKIELA